MKKIFVLLLSLVSISGMSQHTWRYTGYFTPGFSVGETSGSYLFQTVHGLKKKQLYIGVSTGVDDYLITHIPILPYVQYQLTDGENGPLVYAQAGPAIPLRTKDWNNIIWDGHVQYDLHRAWMTEAGIGYQWKLSDRKGILVQAGYSNKTTRATEYFPPYQWWLSSMFLPQEEAAYSEHALKLVYNRIVFRAGIRF